MAIIQQDAGNLMSLTGFFNYANELKNGVNTQLQGAAEENLKRGMAHLNQQLTLAKNIEKEVFNAINKYRKGNEINSMEELNILVQE